MLEITITPSKLNKNYQGFDVKFRGEVILTNQRDPEHSAARELVDRGFTGEMQTYFNDTPSMYFKDIEKAALLTTEEPKEGLRERKWRSRGVEKA